MKKQNQQNFRKLLFAFLENKIKEKYPKRQLGFIAVDNDYKNLIVIFIDPNITCKIPIEMFYNHPMNEHATAKDFENYIVNTIKNI